MITYEPPEQQEVNVGDHIEGIGTVADPDDLKVTELPQRPAVEGNRGGRPMTATNVVCRLLDERGVEYRIERKQTRATFEPFDRFIVLDEHGGLRGTIDVYPDGACNCTWQFNDLTPEQAIAATLGLGTCRVIATKKLGDLFGYRLSCGHSMVNPFDDHPDYCPWCGAKVVEPTTNDVDAEVGE